MRGRGVVVVVALAAAAACSSGDDVADQLAGDGTGGGPTTTATDALSPLGESEDSPATDASVTGASDPDEPVTSTDGEPASDVAPTDPTGSEPPADDGDEPESEPATTASGGSTTDDGSTDEPASTTATTVADGPATTDDTGSTDGSEPAATTPPAGTTGSGDVVASFPEAVVELVQGGEVWAVVLAGASTPDDASLREAELAAEDVGYRTGPTDCDVGAPEALGLPATGSFTVSVYFATESDARSAAAAFAEEGLDGEVALVQTFCLD